MLITDQGQFGTLYCSVAVSAQCQMDPDPAWTESLLKTHTAVSEIAKKLYQITTAHMYLCFLRHFTLKTEEAFALGNCESAVCVRIELSCLVNFSDTTL